MSRMDNRSRAKRSSLESWWTVAFLAAAILCHMLKLPKSSTLALTLALVTATYVALSSRYGELPDGDDRATDDVLEKVEFTLHYPDPPADGWHRSTVIPSRGTFEKEICYGGPPTQTSEYAYAVGIENVICRLVSFKEDDLDGIHHEVVDGRLSQSVIRRRFALEDVEEHIEELKREISWHEVTGLLRYFILCKHGCEISFLSRERDRIMQGFAILEREATVLGAVRADRRYFVPVGAADEETSAAIKNLQRETHLSLLDISFREVIDYEHLTEALDRMLSEKRNAS